MRLAPGPLLCAPGLEPFDRLVEIRELVRQHTRALEAKSLLLFPRSPEFGQKCGPALRIARILIADHLREGVDLRLQRRASGGTELERFLFPFARVNPSVDPQEQACDDPDDRERNFDDILYAHSSIATIPKQLHMHTRAATTRRGEQYFR